MELNFLVLILTLLLFYSILNIIFQPKIDYLITTRFGKCFDWLRPIVLIMMYVGETAYVY